MPKTIDSFIHFIDELNELLHFTEKMPFKLFVQSKCARDWILIYLFIRIHYLK